MLPGLLIGLFLKIQEGWRLSFPFAPRLGHVCLPACRTMLRLPDSQWDFLCWSELSIGRHLFISLFLAFTQENTEETSGKPETLVLHLCGMRSVPLRDSDPRLWESLTLGSYFCHILSTPVCCWVGGKIKAT